MVFRSSVLGAAVGLLFGMSFAHAADSGTVTIALGADVNTLDPDQTASVGTDLSVLSHIYSPLVIRGPDLKLHPAVALSWQAVNDTTWRFVLDPKAHFADGEKMDAAAVKWNLDRVRDPKFNARIRSWFDLIKDVKVDDPTTVDVDMTSPYPAFPDQLSMFFLLPPQWTQSHNPVTQTLSGGRYMMTEDVPGDHITLTANPDYWGDKPQFNKVVFRIIPDAEARTAALLTGEVDLVTGLPVDDIKRINASGAGQAGAVASTRSVFIKFNTLKPPFDNKVFRQALNYAVDKEAIATSIFGGLADVSTCQVLTKNYFGYNPDLKPYPFDPAKAKAMLKQSGVSLSQPIELDVPTGVYLQADEVSQAVASELQDVGLNIKIDEMDFSAYMNKYLKTDDLAPTSLLAQAWPTLDADGLLTLFAPGNPYAYWNDKTFGDALVQARSTTNPATRLAIYKQATATMCDAAPVLFLYTQPATYGVSKRITWEARGDDWVRAFDMHPRS